jgi:RHS repeat-associated protein
VAQQIDYDEWGNVTNLVDPACTLGGTELCFQPFGFAGGIWEPATGLVRFGARDYDPQARRWAQKDPITFAGKQWNIYVYAGDDPINGIDPDGKDFQSTYCAVIGNLFLGACYVACVAGTEGTGLAVCLGLCTAAAGAAWEFCNGGPPPRPGPLVCQ